MGGCNGKGTGAKAPKHPGTNDKTDKIAEKEKSVAFQQTMEFLNKVPLFKRLPKDQHPLLAAACVTVEFEKDEQIIKQGDVGNEFFIIKSGSASVLVSKDGGTPERVSGLKQSDFFGENALLREEPRTATIVADSSIVALKITREKFTECNLQDKIQFANRNAVGVGGGGRKLRIEQPSPKSKDEEMQIKIALRQNENLNTMVTLDDDRVQAMINVAWQENVSKGTAIITEGDLTADYFYVVKSGSFEVLQAETTEGQPSDKMTAVGDPITKGGSFGELALLYLTPRAATVKAIHDSVVYVFDRQNFKDILMKSSSAKIEEYVGYLNEVALLDTLLADEKAAMAAALVEMHFAKDEVILEQGTMGNTFYILYEGAVSVTVSGEVVQQLTCKGKKVQFFGERALLNNVPRDATIKVTSENAKALALDRDSFDMLLGPLEEIMKKGHDRTTNLGKKVQTGGEDRHQEKIVRKDLLKIGLLGCGGFGAVELFEHKITKETYAMKGLSKGYIVKTGMQKSVMNEKNILMMTNSVFIIKLWETYNGSQTLYFLLESALGGELYQTYNRRGFHGNEKHAKFYVAGTVLGFEHMHERRIIYRDLKPENLLLCDKGRLKITDMGLAKFVIGKTYTTCGTPDYFAPELIASTGHTNAVDWWTLGVLIFELMSGHPPFESAYPMQIYSKVMKGINKVSFPPRCQGPQGDLIKALLKSNPSERLPMRPGGVKNLRDHKWYSGFDWDSYEKLTMTPPHTPQVKSKKDTSNFSARKEDMPKQLEYKNDGSGWDNDFATSV